MNIPSQCWSIPMDYEPPESGEPVFEDLQGGGYLPGLSVGGLGAGSIGRDYRGNFRRWTIKAGCLKDFVDPANGFTVYQRPEGGQGRTFMLQDSREDAPGAAASLLALVRMRSLEEIRQKFAAARG